MANGDVSFPKIADSSWWKLRELFKKKVPAIVTPTYLATALSMEEASAKSNLISPFKKIGIIDDDGKPTDLAYDWRDDHKYESVCESLIDKYYPQELRDLFHSADADPQKVTNWFMSTARCGEPAAKMFSRFYLLLLKADLKESDASTLTKDQKSKSQKPLSSRKTNKTPTIESFSQETLNDAQPEPIAHKTSHASNFRGKSPELHINIQLHISPESSAEQIDKIFESMARHLKDFNN